MQKTSDHGGKLQKSNHATKKRPEKPLTQTLTA